MLIAKKYFFFHGLHRKKAGLKRVRIAKKIHSSSLSLVSRNIAVDFWYVGMGGASLVDYYLKYCIKGRYLKITISGSNIA